MRRCSRQNESSLHSDPLLKEDHCTIIDTKQVSQDVDSVLCQSIAITCVTRMQAGNICSSGNCSLALSGRSLCVCQLQRTSRYNPILRRTSGRIHATESSERGTEQPGTSGRSDELPGGRPKGLKVFCNIDLQYQLPQYSFWTVDFTIVAPSTHG